MRTYKVIYRDANKHILAVVTVNCASVAIAVDLSVDKLDSEGNQDVLCKARFLSVDEQVQ